jgi:hypothetical protein
MRALIHRWQRIGSDPRVSVYVHMLGILIQRAQLFSEHTIARHSRYFVTSSPSRRARR